MVNQTSVTTGGGGFLRILGIIYLVKMIRQRRRERSQRAADARADGQVTEGPGGHSHGGRDRRPGA
jgi:hypothetical protein